MPAMFGGTPIGAMQYGGTPIAEAMIDGQVVYRSAIKLTGTSGMTSRTQLRDAVAARGLDYRTVTHLPFKIDTSQATSLLDLFNGWRALVVAPDMTTLQVTDMGGLFRGCTALEYVGDLQTSNVTNAGFMFDACPALMDGNVRLLGKHPNVSTTAMIANSGLTREPWYSADGLRALVTPVAPTFHDGEPWITLPTVEGVTYTVDGTTGYGQTVTVTATAQDGYQLDGQTEWEHTYGPPPRYTASNSGSYGRSGTTSWLTITTHTVTGGGPASGAFTAERSFNFANYGLRVQVDGQTVAERPYGTSSQYEHTIAIPERTYTNGQTITFQTRVHSVSARIESWSWSLS